MASFALSPIASAEGKTCTWTGSAGDHKFATATNWKDCDNAAPTNGDHLVFDSAGMSDTTTLTNNISNLTIGGMTFKKSNPSRYVNLDVNLGTVNLAGNIQLSEIVGLTGIINLTKDATVSGKGMLLHSGRKELTLNVGSHTLTSSTYVGITSLSGSGVVVATGQGAEVHVSHDAKNFTGENKALKGANLTLKPGIFNDSASIIASGSNITLCGFNGAAVNNPLTVGGGSIYTNKCEAVQGSAGGAESASVLQPKASVNWTVLHPFGQVGSGTMCFGVWAKQRLAGETTYDWTVDASRGAVCEYQTFWLSGAKDVSAWTVGQFAFREDNATTTSTVAPAVTTAEGSNYVMHISGERTRAEETGDQITVSGTGFTKDIHAVIGDRTTTVSSSTVEAASETVGPVTTTYPNAHNFNGIAGLIVVPGSSSATPTGLAIRRSNGSTLEVAYLKVSDGGGNLMTPGGLKVVKPGYASVDSMLSQETFYIAHRGGSRFFPEMSLYAYGQSVLLGYGALEFSMARTSDGVWFGLHDRSLDRTSGVSGLPDASNMTWAQVQNYQILGSMAADAPSQPNRPYMRLEELLDLYYPSHVIFMDTKYAGGYIGEFVNIMSSLPGTPQNHIVSKSFGVGPGLHGPMRAAGFMAWGYYYQSNVTSGDFAAWQSNFDILGMEYGADAASWSAATSTGKPVIGHICPTTAAAATALGRGARGLICSGVKLIQTPYSYT